MKSRMSEMKKHTLDGIKDRLDIEKEKIMCLKQQQKVCKVKTRILKDFFKWTYSHNLQTTTFIIGIP